MKNKIHTIIYIIITIVLIGAIAVLGFNLYNKKTLEKEVKNIKEKDINNYEYSKNTKTYLEYKKIEEAIKEYMKEYSDNIKEVNNIINDDEIRDILSATNYEKDGKEFNNSTKLLTEKIKEFNEAIDKLYELNTEEKIMSYINNKNTTDKYIEIYKKYMLEEENLENNKRVIDNLKEKGTKILNTDLEVINLLKSNPDSWTVTEDKISFYSNSLMEKYNTLISNIEN